jgi:hypothetical protein
MYAQYAQRRGASRQWILDDSSLPFKDNLGFGNTATTTTATNPAKSTALVSGALRSQIFTSTVIGKFPTTLFKQGNEDRSFAIHAVVLPIPGSTTGDQQILSHDGIFDGLTINGKVISFSTIYTTAGDATCSYDLGVYRRADAIGVHTSDENQLWVDGEMVASVQLTDAQKADTYSVSDGFLYCGGTSSTQKVALNAVSIYPVLDGNTVSKDFQAGIDVLSQLEVVRQYDGVTFGMNSAYGNVFLDETFSTKSDFQGGAKNDVEYSDEGIVPTYVGGVSASGEWKVGVPLDALGDTSIYGVMVEWTGTDVTVEYSLDGTTWATATNGSLLSSITSGYDPTDADLQLSVSLGSGIVDDPAILNSIRVVGFRNNTFDNPTTRTVTVGYPAVLRDDYEPILYRDDNGVSLHGQTLTIGTDTTSDPQVARSVEVWIKPLSGTPTFSFTGTKYRNGVADTTLPVGEWSCVTYVAASDIAGTITINGDCIVGQVTIYPIALSAGQVAQLYQSYTGRPAFRVHDTLGVTMSETATPTSIYAHDWSIDAAG